MKDKLAETSPGWSTRPGIIMAATVIGGYWTSQMLASYFVSGAVMGVSSMMTGLLCFVLFAVLFVLHLFKPWSRTAAILGLCSFGAFTAMIAYLSGPGVAAYAPSMELMILISAGLGMLGIAVDALYPTQF
jgi:hypothetical protein